MKINREKLLDQLEMVRPGLSPREFIEQSSCFVFKDGMVMTFNDEIACRIETDLKIEGAIQANNLISILEKIDDPELDVALNDDGQLEFKAKRKRFGIVMDAEIFLPIDSVEKPTKGHELSKEFTEAIGLVQHCISTDESKFVLTCIHITPDYIEACDNLQIMRVKVDTGVKESILVRGKSLAQIVNLGMDKMSVTKSWIHFQNHTGMVFSTRIFTDDYEELDDLMEVEKGSDIVIPKGLKEAAERASVFATDRVGDAQVGVKIRDGRVRLRGEGVTGFYEEVKRVAYDGPPIEFVIAPELLCHISSNYSDAKINESKLKAGGGQWTYVTVLGAPSKKEETE